MIDCVEERIVLKNKKIKCKNPHRRKISVFIIFFIVSGSLFIHYKSNVSRILSETCVKSAEEITIDAVNNVVLESLSELKYSDLAEVSLDNSGNIKMINIDVVETNKIARTVSIKTKKLLEQKIKNGVPVPFGTLSGLAYFSGAGKTIFLQVVTVKNVYCDFSSDFLEGGINQTVHRIYLIVKAEVTVVIPGVKNEAEFDSEILLCESLLVGKVPEIIVER